MHVFTNNKVTALKRKSRYLGSVVMVAQPPSRKNNHGRSRLKGKVEQVFKSITRITT